MNTIDEFDRRVEEEYAFQPESDPSGLYSAGRWTVKEHECFLKGLQKHGRNWKLIQGLIKSRSATQVRTHAQKFFTRDNYQATKRGRYASRLKEIESPEMMQWLRMNGALTTAAPRAAFVPKNKERTTSPVKKKHRETSASSYDQQHQHKSSSQQHKSKSNQHHQHHHHRHRRPETDMMVIDRSDHFIKQEPMVIDRSDHFIKQEPNLMISMSDPDPSPLLNRQKDEDSWDELSMVEPLEFFVEEMEPAKGGPLVAGSSNQGNGPDDCLDWLTETEMPSIPYYDPLVNAVSKSALPYGYEVAMQRTEVLLTAAAFKEEQQIQLRNNL